MCALHIQWWWFYNEENMTCLRWWYMAWKSVKQSYLWINKRVKFVFSGSFNVPWRARSRCCAEKPLPELLPTFGKNLYYATDQIYIGKDLYYYLCWPNLLFVSPFYVDQIYIWFGINLSTNRDVVWKNQATCPRPWAMSRLFILHFSFKKCAQRKTRKKAVNFLELSKIPCRNNCQVMI